MKISTQVFDAIIVGGGGAGLRASIQLAQSGLNVGVISKVFPTRSHTVAAQGGISASLGNMHSDDWKFHAFDTIKGGDYMCDQEAVMYMCQQAQAAVYELEHMGMPFSRTKEGKIYQRPFGGHTSNYGEKPVERACAVEDRTGHAMLHTLYQQNVKHKAKFLNEWFALDLIKGKNGGISGVTAMCMETSEIVFFQARAVVLATGGAGQVYKESTNALINTGDGLGMALRAGLFLQDMEMWQFHPTGIAGAGVLMTEGCRGEGGYLINKNGERFMERYEPVLKDLACRDVVSRCCAIEIQEGRGCGPNGDYVLLKLDHLGAEALKKRLPGISESAKIFAGVDVTKEPAPVVPTIHYMMGGIPTNIHGQVVTMDAQGHDIIVEGLYAAGECACVSVHGANRLGTNSLLDIVVFGRAAGMHMEESIREGLVLREASDDIEKSVARVRAWNTRTKTTEDTVATIKAELKATMQKSFGVFRHPDLMASGLSKIKELQERIKKVAIKDHSQVFNTERLEALELENLLAVARTTAVLANLRTESRGAHARVDFETHDDSKWYKHLLVNQDDVIRDRPIQLEAEPKAWFKGKNIDKLPEAMK